MISDKYAFTEGRPPNITLKVLSRIEEPFVMFRKVNWECEALCDDIVLSRLLLVTPPPLATQDLKVSVWICWSRLPIRLINWMSHLDSELSISLI